MQQAETVVMLFALVATLVIIARKLAVPYPVFLVVGGLALSFIPDLPDVKLNPAIVLYFFLPPLLYPAALFTSWRDFRRNLQPILFLAIGLVLCTMVVVAFVAHSLIPDLPWATAFALGAIVSPPDAIAATSVIRRLSVPRRIEAVLEGESLVNDATALVALQFAVAALITGRFSLGNAALHFVWAAIGGIGFGLLIAFIVRWVQRHLDDPPIQITISLLTPFLAYLPAERMHASGVLATVAAGIYLGWHSPLTIRARTRIPLLAFWEIVTFLLNGFVFITIGLQLPGIVFALRQESLKSPITNALLVSGAVVLVRIIWVFAANYLPQMVSTKFRRRDPYPSWKLATLVSWAGMRGVVSLAAAFALPFALMDGSPFPARNYILFLTFCVILTTLVVQGLTLPLIIKKLRIGVDHSTDEEERSARVEANKAAIERIEELSGNGEFSRDTVDRLRAEYDERLQQLQLCSDNPDDCTGQIASPQFERLQQEALNVERSTIIRLRNQRVINDEALRRIQRDLDLAEARLTG
jgi:CPA1 family monovalent cation:H+ antiporter